MPFSHFEAHKFCTNIFFTIFAWIILKICDIVGLWWRHVPLTNAWSGVQCDIINLAVPDSTKAYSQTWHVCPQLSIHIISGISKIKNGTNIEQCEIVGFNNQITNKEKVANFF
jgi:nitrate reductase gamma subunit